MKALFTCCALVLCTALVAQDFERVNPDLELSGVASINIHPSGVGYAPQECGAVLKTTDGGTTWIQIFPDVSDASFLGFITFLDDNDPDKVVYHSQYSLIRSEDGFVTSHDIKPNSISGFIRDFVVLESGRFGLAAGTFLYSDDEGMTWTETQTPDVDGLDLMEMDGALYTAFRAIMRSTDGGVTFDTVFYNTDTKRKFVNLNGKPVLSSISNLYTSNDGGLTWEMIPAVDYYGYADNLNVYGGRLIANSSNRINYSDDNGVTWASVIMPEGIHRTTSMFVNDTGRIYIGGEASQLYVTGDPNTPIEVLFGDKEELSNIVSKGARVVATGNDGVLMRSEDSGATWTRNIITDRNLDVTGFIGNRLFVANDNLELLRVYDDNSMVTVLVHDRNFNSFEVVGDGQTAFISSDKSIFRTEDAGDNWSEVYAHAGQISKMHVMANGLIAFMDYNGTLYSSNNAGGAWQLLSASPDTNAFYLDFTVFDEMNFMVMSSSMLFSTSDGGATWASYFRPYNGARLFNMANGSALCLGINGADGWLYKSDDQGNTFPQIAKTCATLSRGAFYDADADVLWVVGSGLGIQRVEFDVSATTTGPEVISSIQVFPNPADDIIYFQADISQVSRISIYDMMGSRVKTLYGGVQSMDISSLVPGTYHVVMQDGETVLLSRFIRQGN